MELPDGWTTETVRANGVDLQVYRGGAADGPTLVAVHGFGGSGRCWLPLATDLTDRYRVLTYDARAHGQSAAPETGYAVADRVDDLCGLLDALELDDPVLLGHSMGAGTVAHAAAAEPSRPRAVVLEDPVAVHEHDPDSTAEERVAAVREQVPEGRPVERLLDEEYDDVDPEWARRLAVADTELAPTAAEYARHTYPAPLRAVFPGLDAPTLVLRSDRDHEERVRDLAAGDALPDGRLVHVPDAGHYVFADRYDAAMAELRAFLTRV
ncbi:alpha/beta hydrolase [Halobacteriales archaeon SW_5_70_135]|nr:MAG: alpha/beta hydrolase [Halobacteriales archaeon SW_5_70_135]